MSAKSGKERRFSGTFCALFAAHKGLALLQGLFGSLQGLPERLLVLVGGPREDAEHLHGEAHDLREANRLVDHEGGHADHADVLETASRCIWRIFILVIYIYIY